MDFGELLGIYFQRTDSLQSLWTLYVLVIAILLAFSSVRKRPDVTTTALVSVLFIAFSYKNLGAITEQAGELQALLDALRALPMDKPQHAILQTQHPTTVGGAWAFHMTCDILTVVTAWAMEWRRRRWAAEDAAAAGSAP